MSCIKFESLYIKKNRVEPQEGPENGCPIALYKFLVFKVAPVVAGLFCLMALMNAFK